MSDIENKIMERVTALGLSKARTEGAAHALADAHERGEWPPPANISMPARGDAAAVASRVVDALRATHVKITGPMHAAIRRAIDG